MNHRALAPAASLSEFRRGSAPLVAVLTFAAFLFTLIPPRPREAQAAPADPIPTAPDTPSGQAPGSGVGSPNAPPSGGLGPVGGAVDLPVSASGSFNYSFAFALLHARGAVQPSLLLNYSSSIKWGVAGRGFELKVPMIQRAPKPGQDSLGLRPDQHDPPKRRPSAWMQHDRFLTADGDDLLLVCIITNGVCSGALTGERMPLWSEGWSYYRPRVETKFDRYFFSSDHKTWRVQVKGEAIDYELGAALDGSYEAIEKEQTWGYPYKWWIARAYDATGGARESKVPNPTNQVAFRYERGPAKRKWIWDSEHGVWNDNPSGPLYLSEVYDTSPRNDPTTTDVRKFAHHTHLTYETRPDTQPLVAWGRMLGNYDRRLARIDVTSKPFASASDARELVRRYHLTYLDDQVSVLRTIQMEGRCDSAIVETSERLPDVTNCKKLAPTTFGYDDGTAPTPSLLPPDRLGEIRGLELVLTKFGDDAIQYVDINHDGLVDLLITAPEPFQGKHAVWLNGLKGKAGQFEQFAVSMKTLRTDTAESLSPSKPDTLLGDFDGNGTLDMLVAPAGEPSRLYSLEGAGTAWGWVGRELPAPLAVSLKEKRSLRAVDVDGDGTTDVLVTTDTETLTYFSLARSPGGWGRFGATVSTPDGERFSPQPARAPIPRLASGEPVALTRSDVRIADINGDRLPDLVHVTRDGVRFWAGTGTGIFGDFPERDFSSVQPSGFLALGAEFKTDTSTVVRFGDVNGDGLDDLVTVRAGSASMWPNQNGAGWGSPFTVKNPPTTEPGAAFFKLASVRGHGRESLAWVVGGTVTVSDWVGAERLLMLVSNGYGATTAIAYSELTAVELARRAGGKPVRDMLPSTWLATGVTKSDNLDLVGGTKGSYVSHFDYEEPYLNPADQKFVGFRTVTATHDGDAARPTEIQRIQYHLGECQDDPETPAVECGSDMDATGNPRAALAMRPKRVERLDAQGNLLEAVHYGYRLRHLYSTERGWTMHAYGEHSDVRRYGTPNTPSSSTETLVDLRIDKIGAGDPAKEESAYPARELGASMAMDVVVDVFGNARSTTDLGRLGGWDTPIRNGTDWSLPIGDKTGWTYRPKRTWRTSSTEAVITDMTHEVFTDFDEYGRPVTLEATLTGTQPLERFRERSPSGITPVPPAAPSASTNGRVRVASLFYDELGNATGTVRPNHRCTEVTYDSLYGHLPTDSAQYAGALGATPHPVLGACGGTVLRSFATFDRGLERMKQSLGFHGEKAAWTYDTFGRLTGTFKPDPSPDPTHLGEFSSDAAVKFTYVETPDSPIARTLIETLYVNAAGEKSYRRTWTLRDGFSRTVATIDEADPSAGDGAEWIVRDVVARSARGDVTRAYLPWFWDGTPKTALPSDLVPKTKFSSATFDAFGRAVDTFAIDGTRTSHHDYTEALGYVVFDAEDLATNSDHANTPTTVRFDGHGRVVSESISLHEGSAKGVTETQYAYDHDDNLVQIKRVHAGTQDTPIVRRMAYDSLGRMVLNVEPNTSTSTDVGPSRAPILRAWRYAYNDNGDLVGTSDARGCGKNLHYDAGGRLIAEDYWPCLLAQGPYTRPDLTTGEGTEAFYRYDSLPADGQAVLNANTSVTLGRLTAVYDRASATVFRFDGRGRTTAVARRIARPGATSATPAKLSERYGSHWFMKETAYRDDEGIAWSTTGAEAADLLDPSTGASSVTPLYSKRGAVVGLTSSYGKLLASVKRSAEGLELEAIYGDAASTTTTTTYDARLRTKTVETARAKAAGWTAAPPVISPPPTAAGGTMQLVLESLEYGYDAVGNPTSIKDHRDPSEWPTGAKPASRTFKYDDLYRLTEAKTSFAGVGYDRWTSPYEAEIAGPVDDAKRDRPATPTRSFAKRTMSQTFTYDWLGNTTKTTDDDAQGFYERSLGTITNGTPTRGPNQIQSATTGNGNLAATYDPTGNLIGLSVRRQCTPAGAFCEERYGYEWDEVGRLSRARRWDVKASEAIGADLTYVYDAGGQRVLKTSSPPGAEARHSLYVFGSLEVRRARWFSADNDYERTATTEVPRLGSLGRVVFANEGLPLASAGKRHVLLELPGALGSTSTVLDKETGELVEKKTFQAFGAAESDYRPARWASFREEVGFTGKEEDIEVGLVYFGQRYLAPYLGRWVSADPLTVHAAGADLNAYAYVKGRATVATDPNGLAPCIGPNCIKQGTGGQDGAINATAADKDVPQAEEVVVTAIVPAMPDTTPGTGSGHGQPLPADRGGGSSSDGIAAGDTGKRIKDDVIDPLAGLANGLLLEENNHRENGGFTYGHKVGSGGMLIAIGLTLASSLGGGGAAAGGTVALASTGVGALVIVGVVAVAAVAIAVQKTGSDSQPETPEAAPSEGAAEADPGPYKRPSGATTPQQRASVQGKPCVDCGETAPRMNADHKDPLVKEYYRNGGQIDQAKMRDMESVQPQCPTCSNRQGGFMSSFGRAMKRLFGYD